MERCNIEGCIVYYLRKMLTTPHLYSHSKTDPKQEVLFFSIFGWGDPFQPASWSEGWLKLLSSLEKPSDKCQRTHIIQNSFHDV